MADERRAQRGFSEPGLFSAAFGEMRLARVLSASLGAEFGARRKAMLKTTIATMFIALAAGASVSVACVQSTEETAQAEPRFTRHEAPNHRHLMRHQETRRAQ
jgi:hypothetical protein